jgi:hypothetical protein
VDKQCAVGFDAISRLEGSYMGMALGHRAVDAVKGHGNHQSMFKGYIDNLSIGKTRYIGLVVVGRHWTYETRFDLGGSAGLAGCQNR